MPTAVHPRCNPCDECFKGAARKQHLEEEIKWLQQLLAKEQQSKQTVLGQLQDEKAKCAMLEMEILHAAQAAQEMGESLCLFFNPCYQQSEQQPLQLALQTGEDEAVCEQAIPLPPLDQEGYWQQHEEANSPNLTQQQQQRQEQEPFQHQDDPPSDPDTAAHDQAVHRTRDLPGVHASSDLNLNQPEGQLFSPCRSLKSSPGRRNSPRRLARSSPCRSLRLSSSSNPVKQTVLAAAATATDSKGYKQAAEHIQGPDAQASKPVPVPTSAATAGSMDDAASQALGGDQGLPLSLQPVSGTSILAAAQQQVQDAPAAALAQAPQQQLHQQPDVLQQLALSAEAAYRPACMDTAAGLPAHTLAHDTLQQCQLQQQPQKQEERDNTNPTQVPAQPVNALAAATATAGAAQAAPEASEVPAAALPVRGAASKLPLSAAAAAAAAIQQSVSAASAAIAAAEAARSNHRTFAGGLLAPFGSPMPPAATGPGNAAGGVEAGHADSSTTGASSSNTGSSSKSACDAPSHKLPLGIVSDPAVLAVNDEPAVSTGQASSKAEGLSAGAQESSSGSSIGPQTAPVSCRHSPIRAAASLCSSRESSLAGPLPAQPEAAPACHSSSGDGDKGGITSANTAPVITRGPPGAGSRDVTQSAQHQDSVERPPSCQEGRDGPMASQNVAAGKGAAADLTCVMKPPSTSQPVASGASRMSGTAALQGSGSVSSVVHTASSDTRSSSSPSAATAASERTPLDGPLQQLNEAAGSPQLADMAAPVTAVQPAVAAAAAAGRLSVTARSGQCNVTHNSSIGPHSSSNAQLLPTPATMQQPLPQRQQRHQCGNLELQVPRLTTKQHTASRLSLSAHSGGSTGHASNSWPVPATADNACNHSCAPGGQLSQQSTRGGSLPKQVSSEACREGSNAMHKPAQVLRPSQQLQQSQQHLQASWGYRSIACLDPLGAGQPPLLPRPQSLDRRTAATVLAAPAATDAATVAGVVQRKPAAAEVKLAAASGAHALTGSMVAAAAGTNPASCLSPLHWHQSNLGSSRGDFYQAMMLSACSNPNSVMRQQLAFDEQDSQKMLKAIRRQGGSKGVAGGAGVQGSIAKPRKRWMALF